MRNMQGLTYDFGKHLPGGKLCIISKLALLLVNLPDNQYNIYL